uniref:Xyloglucan endotransglucosylase/hydrolase n=1 Tax=Selaginella kraussiana TaxID=81964 RepID=Q1XD17_9TRAC|nr:putative xyloglucan endotransglucosylase/hydrolase [Selaginella kraussiana]
MGVPASFIVVVLLLATPCIAAPGKFQDYFKADRINDHIRVQDGGTGVQLVLDQKSASGFESKDKFLFGKISMQLKLVPGDSAGTVTAYYAASENYVNRDEIDLEFLGNTTGNPYIVQTNIYTNGVGNREQRHYLWFDPTADYHSYSFLWNQKQIVFYVDSTPIRVFPNAQDIGVPFPTKQPMGVYSSLWNADDWATQGGRVKTNWGHAPFVASYRNFDLDACAISSGSCTNSAKWWDASAYAALSPSEISKLKWVEKNYLVYDYCKDPSRFSTKPAECARAP